MAGTRSDIPDQLLQAAAECTGRIALVVGAGCSLEDPTGLKLANQYAREVHDALVADRVLEDGECSAPDDLSAVTSAVWAKRRSQQEVVTRLPRNKFRNARANDGYLAAAALLRERAVSAVLSLNFDLAMSHALTELSADEVAVIAGPEATRDLGSYVVIYLHRNVNEPDADRWILRTEALRSEWQGQWEEALAQRVVSSPIVVFAGLGSPAAVLTETVSWIRERLQEQHNAYVVDPDATTAFKDALHLPDGSHVAITWCEFMQLLADRLSEQLRSSLRDACSGLCAEHSWNSELEHVDALCGLLFASGLVDAGRIRARWLLARESYTPDEENGRAFVADLLLGLGLAQRHSKLELAVRRNGVVELRQGDRIAGSCLPVSGKGVRRWTALEPRIMSALNRFSTYERPSAVLMAGMQGPLPADVSPPLDLVYGSDEGDITEGRVSLQYVTVDELREDATSANRLAS
ncbi:MAG: hypothetical protein M0010_05280 [Actinomycetota bacterium]|nr:hypothetical protein [Actinomycetota bacterium]